MPEALIVGAVRTPVGRRNGGLSDWHPADLAGFCIESLVERTGVDGEQIDDVILGCVGQVGPQTLNIARTAALSAGLPESVPGVTIDRQCGSSQQAVQFAAQAIGSGSQDLVVAGGIEMMSVVPMGSSRKLAAEAGLGGPFDGERWQKRYGGREISQFRGAELIAERWEISREEMERYALESHRRAGQAWDDGDLGEAVVPCGEVVADEGIRRDSTLEKMASLKPLVDGGRLTAAVSSQISDAASAVLVASPAAAERLGLEPLARVGEALAVGSDPELMLTGPIPATRRLLECTKLGVDDIDLFEVNEAFASVVLAWQRELGVESERVNRFGGAIAVGHPIGASGTRILADLVYHLRRTGGQRAVQAICEGGGTANALLLERV